MRRIKADQNISFRTGVAPSKHRIAVCLTGLWCSSKVKVPVMQAITKSAGLTTEGRGIVFSLPVNDVMGVARVTEELEEAEK